MMVQGICVDSEFATLHNATLSCKICHPQYWGVGRGGIINVTIFTPDVKLNFKATLFSGIFWFEDSFLCKIALLVYGLFTL